MLKKTGLALLLLAATARRPTLSTNAALNPRTM